MVTVFKLKGVNAAAAAEYFEDLEHQRTTGDYYAGPDGQPVQSPGAWLGKLAVRMGMSGDVTIEQLLRLLDGCHPETGERLVPWRKDRVAAHDLTFSAPKSVSAVWALASDAIREAAQATAVAEALAYVERRLLPGGLVLPSGAGLRVAQRCGDRGTVVLRSCARRGAVIDVVADRAREQRSQIVFTRARGREMVFWQSPRTHKQARPNVAVPTARAAGVPELVIVVDTRERYGYRFAAQRELATLPRAAVVVEDRYSQVFTLDRIRPAVVADGLAELQVRWPMIPIVFCETRKLAEEWTYRSLGAAHAWAQTEDPVVIGCSPTLPIPLRPLIRLMNHLCCDDPQSPPRHGGASLG